MPFSRSFQEHINSSNASCPPLEYFAYLLLNLVNNVIPPLPNSKGEGQNHSYHQLGSVDAFEPRKAFYQIQDPGTYTQLILETAVIEILSLPVTTTQIISAFVQIIINKGKIIPNLTKSNHGFHTSTTSSDSYSDSNNSFVGCGSNPLTIGFDCSNFVLAIQACGLLLAQLPVEFHIKLYDEVSYVIKEHELHSLVGYALLDPTWAVQENTSTAFGKF